MAQVKKYQAGGSLTIGGQTYKGDNLAEDLRAKGRLFSPEVQNVYNRIADAVANGANISYDDRTDTITGMDGMWGISQKENDKLSKTDMGGLRRTMNAIAKTDSSNISNAIHYLRNYQYNDPKAVEAAAEAAKKSTINGDIT